AVLAIQTTPNPFTSNIDLLFQTDEPGIVTIRVFNITGQQQLVKNVSVSSGSNTIRITEAANLAKGVYMIQVNKNNKLISSGKIIKQ
ncbi:MAG TPA: T9SS type A sorting domain-containing protein, partial [Chitinophagaceae bacterium]